MSLLPSPKWRPTRESERIRWAEEERALKAGAGPMFLGVDVGLAEGDYTVEMEIKVDAKGVVRVVSMRADRGAPRPDPGTDMTDNGLHRPR